MGAARVGECKRGSGLLRERGKESERGLLDSSETIRQQAGTPSLRP